MKTTLNALSTTLILAALSGNVLAAPTLCSAGSPHADGLSVSDMTFQGNNANDCYGVVSANDSGSNVWTDTGWTLFAKDDVGGALSGGTILGITFSLDALPNTAAKSGTWVLSWAQTGLPGYDLTMDVVGVLKASNGFASYLFEDLMFTADGSGSGTWKITYENNGGQIPDLSHLSLYYKNAVHSSTSTSSTSGQTTSGSQVSEPGMLGLIGLGLLGQAFLLRQRRRRQEA